MSSFFEKLKRRKVYRVAAVHVVVAEIYSMLGDADAALPLLEHSLSARVGINVHKLRLDPFWDPIRKDPRLRAFIEKYSAKT